MKTKTKNRTAADIMALYCESHWAVLTSEGELCYSSDWTEKDAQREVGVYARNGVYARALRVEIKEVQ